MNLRKCENYYKLKIKSYYKKTIDDSFSMWPHSHEYIEIMDVKSGYCYLDIYDNKQLVKTELVGPNTLIIIVSDFYHKIRSHGECIISNLEFDTSLPSSTSYIEPIPYLKNSSEWKGIFNSKYGIITMSDVNGISNTIDRIIMRIQNVGLVNNDVYLDSYIFHFLIKISDCYKTINQYSDTGSFYYNKAIAIIKRDLSKDISIRDICNELNITVSYLERIFKESIRMSVKKYADLLKLDLIKNELINTEESIVNIYRRYGYKNLAQLSYQFKQVYNLTPLEYRKKFISREFHESNDEYTEKTFNA